MRLRPSSKINADRQIAARDRRRGESKRRLPFTKRNGVCSLLTTSRTRISQRVRRRMQLDETVQSTSMFKKHVCSRCSAALAPSLPAPIAPAPSTIRCRTIRPRCSTSRTCPPAPVRVASNANMGGGFIEFLFGDGPGRGPAYAPQQSIYQQQPGYNDPRRLPPMGEPQMQSGLQQEAIDPRQRQFDPKFEKQSVDYSGKESAGTIVVDTQRTSFSIWSRATAGRCATASASDARASPGRA